MEAPPYQLHVADRRSSEVDLRLEGRANLEVADDLRHDLLEELPQAPARADGTPETELRVRLDLRDLEKLDGAAAAVVLAVRGHVVERGGSFQFEEVPPFAQALFDLYGCPSEAVCLREAPRSRGILDYAGLATVSFLLSLKRTLDFTGGLVVSTLRALRSPSTIQWRELPEQAERTGANAVPIVLLINFLVGFIIALQSATQLERFGAQIFVADLVGLSVTRELAPLMTAIVAAGRTGAAFAAELGSMKVSEEIDALHTMGIDPNRHLVLPRLFALMLCMPLLTVLSDIFGCLGGLLVALWQLDLSATTYLNSLEAAVGLSDVLGGLFKSVVFGGIIALIACEQGLSTRGGAVGVGRSTTTSVVMILLALILSDALFTGLFQVLGI